MTNVTLSVDEEDLKQARVLALEQGTSLNAVIREFIKDYIGRTKRYGQVTERILRAAEHSKFDSGGRTWTRGELHERQGVLRRQCACLRLRSGRARKGANRKAADP